MQALRRPVLRAAAVARCAQLICIERAHWPPSLRAFYDHCTTPRRLLSNRKAVLHTFHNNPDFEFVQVNDNTIYANCINCAPTIMGHYYSTKLSGYIECKYNDGRKIDEAI